MSSDKKLLVLLIIFILGCYQYLSDREVQRPPGVLVSAIPEQKILTEKPRPFPYKSVVINQLAEYKIQARVLSTRKYWLGESADIMPIDVAVGWNEMSDSAVLEELNISQANRFYFYNWQGSGPIDKSIMNKTSANMHLIASNTFVKNQIKKIRTGHIVKLSGQLVSVNFKDGRELKSSLSREDDGAGACELMWVTSIEILD